MKLEMCCIPKNNQCRLDLFMRRTCEDFELCLLDFILLIYTNTEHLWVTQSELGGI